MFPQTLPIHFVREYSDKIQKSVTLRSEADGKRWTVNIRLTFQPRLQALLYGGSWRAFVVANGLVIGDRVTFILVAMSMFEVHILRSSGGQAKGDKLPFMQMSTQRSKPSVLSLRKLKRSIVPRVEGDMTENIDGKEKPEIALNNFSTIAEVNHAANSAPKAADSSQMNSDMESHYFEPVSTTFVFTLSGRV